MITWHKWKPLAGLLPPDTHKSIPFPQSAFVECPACKRDISLITYEIDVDGVVSRPVVCPYKFCNCKVGEIKLFLWPWSYCVLDFMK